MMDLDALLKPYEENGRTIAGQIKWLLKNGIPQASIDYAMTAVYKRLEGGETFPAGHDLDRELLRVAKENFESELSESIKRRIAEMESNLDADWNKLNKAKKIWEVLRGRA